ncbi:hypothetical protein FDP41_004102 [Naegleria fowleri]|uniref:Acyl-CoA dehydrogenase/oxidase C-terminal domain-containing protein n=1 Tax=Naegleria fowleri TaxID=5763 RepID=A0A6A5BIL6_NAEFO|nr:uncharacterized protein FDP41_004102 [Naegleria fowleri]KAF0976807.1 hypothetical protein FDP41_004102 [Naegleria fowleri]CAG4714285.1 unnamed protein product [Naegleria fowleri]
MSTLSITTHTIAPPTLGNAFLEDTALQEILDKHIFSSHVLPSLSESTKDQIRKDLTNFGEQVTSTIWKISDLAERHQPQLFQYDAWQNRIDHIELHPAWKKLNEISAREGIVALGYEREDLGEHGLHRLYQFAKLYLFDPSSSVFTCPLAMGDAAARLMEHMLKTLPPAKTQAESERLKLFQECKNHLTSRDPKMFWTSGQWMTEKKGGSDVSGTETVATHVKDFDYILDGFKWFTSATDSQMTLALAKIKCEKTGKLDDQVSLFLVKMRDEKTQKLNGLVIHKLKNKLGTKALPTAEIEIKGAKATLVSPRGEGVKYISIMMNTTRIYNATCSVAKMRRIISIVQDFSANRTVNRGQLLSHNSLHLRHLSKMVTETTGCLHFVMDVVRMMGREESGIATAAESHLLRLFTPIIKLYTGKKAIQVVSEGLEMIGGMGYIEDTGIPRLLRDAQVLALWEGTTNILSLDVLRVLLHPKTGQEAFKAFSDHIHSVVNSPTSSNVSQAAKTISHALSEIQHYLKTNHSNQSVLTTFARELAFSIAHVQISALLLEHCIVKNSHKNVQILKLFVEEHSTLVILPSQEKIEQIKQIQAVDYLIANESDGYKTPTEKRSRL